MFNNNPFNEYRATLSEGLKGDQHKLDHDKDGDIDGKDFAALRGKKKKPKDKDENAIMNPKVDDKTAKASAVEAKEDTEVNEMLGALSKKKVTPAMKDRAEKMKDEKPKDKKEEGYYKDKQIKAQDKAMGAKPVPAPKKESKIRESLLAVLGEKFDKSNKASIHIPMGADGIDKSEHGKIKKDVSKVGAKVKFHSNGDLSYHGSDHSLSGALKQHHPDDKQMSDLNHHKSGKSDHSYKKEDVDISEDAAHTKGATKPEDKVRGNSNKKMMDAHGKPTDAGFDDEEGHDDAAKAGRAGPKAKARNSGDATNNGDKKVINKVKEAYASMYEKEEVNGD